MALDNFRAIKVRLDSQGDYIPDGIIIKQGDVNGRLFQLYITDYGTPVSMDGVSAIFGYRRPDGVSDMVNFKTVGDHLECAVPEKAGQVVGNVTVELQVKGVDFIVGSRNFILKCESSPASFSGIVNSNSYQDLLKIPDAMLALESDANQIKANAESTLKAQSERGEKIIQENEKAFTDAHADFESRYVAAEKARDGKYETAEAERDRKFNVAQSGRVSDYSSWKSTIASDAESRIQAKEQLFTNSINAANAAKSKFDTDASQALDRVSSSIQAKEQAYDNALKSDKAKYASSLTTQEQAYTQSLSEHESSWESQQASAKSASDGRINKLDNIIAAYEGETPLTLSIADTKYQPKGDYATKSDIEPLATKSELSSYIKNSEGSVTSTNIQDGTIKGSDIANSTITASNLADTYVTETSANRKYATKSTATTSSDGLISASDKSKLDSIQSGAQKNTVTSVNGRTGAVTIEEPAEATTSKAGLISASDKAKLNGIQAGAQKNTINKIEGKSGDNVTFPVATASQWGWMGASDKAKLDKIEAGAQKNPTDYVNTSTLNSRLSQKQDKGSYVSSTDILKIKVVTSIPSSVEPNTLYLVKE